MVGRFQNKIRILIFLAVATVPTISVGPTCFPTCEREDWSVCKPVKKRYTGQSFPSDLSHHTMCISCNQSAEINTTLTTGNCLLRVNWLGFRGLQFGKLSPKKLTAISPSSLRRLVLIQAGITEIDSATFEVFQGLEYLYLDHNMLTHIPSTWHSDTHVRGEYALTYLSISHNKISSLGPACFQNLGNLRWLHLQHNELREVHSQWFIGQNKLEELYLGGNKIETVLPDTFACLIELKLLDLSNNDIVCLQGETFRGLQNIDKVVLGGANLISNANIVRKLSWRAVRENCDRWLSWQELSATQWMRFDVLDIVLYINYEETEERFSIAWISLLSWENYDPTKYVFPCAGNPRLSNFAANSPFVVIATNSPDKTTFSNQCLKAWGGSGGVHWPLKGGSSLRFSVVETGGNHSESRSESFGIVVTKLKNQTDDSQLRSTSSHHIGSGDESFTRVACFVVVNMDKHELFVNVTIAKKEGDTKCPVTDPGISGDRMRKLENTTSSPLSSLILTVKNENTTAMTVGAKLFSFTQTNATPDIDGARNKTVFSIPLKVGFIVAGLFITVCFLAVLSLFVYYYQKRRSHANSDDNRQGFPLAKIRAPAFLQSNAMYQGDTAKTPRDQNVRDSRQENDKTYNEIDEDKVYAPSAPSGHDYCEIKDDDASSEQNPATENPPCVDTEINSKYENDTQDENCDVDVVSVTFYAATASVELPTTRNATANTSYYQKGVKTATLAKCRAWRIPVTKSVEQDQTAYKMTDRTVESNRTNLYKAGTADDIASETIEELEIEQSERNMGTSEDGVQEVELKVEKGTFRKD